MSLSKNIREKIKRYLLHQIDKGRAPIVQKTSETFNVSQTTIRRYLQQLVEDGILKASIQNPSGYELIKDTQFFHYFPKQMDLEEDIIYEQDIYPLLKTLPPNVEKIWKYVFTEIMNNAIEHSNATSINCMLSRNLINTSIFIEDNGIGIFEKIRQYIFDKEGKHASIDDAMVGLFTGKFTTDAESHSGEGIFFSSRSVDTFYILSSNHIFTHDSYELNIAKDITTLDLDSARLLTGTEGTLVKMTLANETKRELKEVFDMFSTVDKGFCKTQIPIKNAIPDAFPVSRSQARRISIGFNKFEVVELDFKEVEDIGQAFADEIFRVFQNKNPDIEIDVINANENIQNMIERVKNTKRG